MKKLTTCFLVVLTIFAFGCSGKKSEEVKSPEHTKNVRIVISGSATTIPILELLADEYTKLNPEIVCDFLPSCHSGGGIKGAYSGELDLGVVSRALEDEESSLGLVDREFARDAITFVSNQNIKVKKISSDQLRKIYSGDITRWSQLGQQGLTNDDMVVIDRPDHSSPKIVLKQGLFPGSFGFGTQLVMVERAIDTNEALIKTPNALGYTSLAAITMGKMPLNILVVDGVKPTPESVSGGLYKYYRPFGIVYRPDARKEVLNFVNFIMSPSGQKIILDNGLTPM